MIRHSVFRFRIPSLPSTSAPNPLNHNHPSSSFSLSFSSFPLSHSIINSLPLSSLSSSAFSNSLPPLFSNYRCIHQASIHSKAATESLNEASSSSAAGRNDFRDWNSFNSCGLDYLSKGDLSSAEAMFLSAIKSTETSRVFEKSPHRYLSLANLGITFKRQNRMKDSADALKTASEALRKFPTLNARIVANCWRELALVLETDNQWTQAFKAYRIATDYYEKYNEKIGKKSKVSIDDVFIERKNQQINKKDSSSPSNNNSTTNSQSTNVSNTSSSSSSSTASKPSPPADDDLRYAKDEANCLFAIALITHRNPSAVAPLIDRTWPGLDSVTIQSLPTNGQFGEGIGLSTVPASVLSSLYDRAAASSYSAYGPLSYQVALICERWALLCVDQGRLDDARERWLYSMDIYKELRDPRLATVIRMYMDSLRDLPIMRDLLDNHMENNGSKGGAAPASTEQKKT